MPAMEEDLDSLDDPFQLDGRSKSPMYDELSLPFIDASLPPTPRIGRTVNGLDILLGNNTGSTNSFAGNDIQSNNWSRFHFLEWQAARQLTV